MKIAFIGSENEFTLELLKGLSAALPADEFFRWQPKQPPPADDLEVLISIGPVTREHMRSQPQLALVQTASDGYEAVAVDAATELGIWVSYTPGKGSGNADSVAEFAVMLLIAAFRRLGAAREYIFDHGKPRPLLNRALLGKTVCIVGYGVIGTRVAERLRPFGVRLIAVNRTPKRGPEGGSVRPMSELKQAFAEADATVVCVRATPKNRHLINADVLGAAKPGAVLVNIARGSLIDEAALVAALESGQIGAAGLDVTEQEPIDPGNPLLLLPQVFLTPHVAGFTDLTLHGTVRSLTEALNRFRQGERPASLLNEPAAPRRPLRNAQSETIWLSR